MAEWHGGEDHRRAREDGEGHDDSEWGPSSRLGLRHGVGSIPSQQNSFTNIGSQITIRIVVSNSIQFLTTSSIWKCGVGKSFRSEKRKNGPEREEVCVPGGLSSFQNFGRPRSEDKQDTDHQKLQGCTRHLCLFEL